MTLYSVSILVATKDRENYNDKWFQPSDYSSWDHLESEIENFFGVDNLSVLEVLEYSGPDIFDEFDTSEDDPEQFVDQEYWEYIKKLTQDELKALQELYNEESKFLSIGQFKFAFEGKYESIEQYAKKHTIRCHTLPEYSKDYIDWSAIASDLFDFGEYFMTDSGSGYVFKSN